MTLSQVEAILGPGQRIEADRVPQGTQEGNSVPVVHGNEYFEWEIKEVGIEIVVALSNGKVCDKWYWEPSL
jgi:hypothetical protein